MQRMKLSISFLHKIPCGSRIRPTAVYEYESKLSSLFMECKNILNVWNTIHLFAIRVQMHDSMQLTVKYSLIGIIHPAIGIHLRKTILCKSQQNIPIRMRRVTSKGLEERGNFLIYVCMQLMLWCILFVCMVPVLTPFISQYRSNGLHSLHINWIHGKLISHDKHW